MCPMSPNVARVENSLRVDKEKFHEEIVTTLIRSKNIGPDSYPDRVNNSTLGVDQSLVYKSPAE
jgi:hypothetical protein